MAGCQWCLHLLIASTLFVTLSTCFATTPSPRSDRHLRLKPVATLPTKASVTLSTKATATQPSKATATQPSKATATQSPRVMETHSNSAIIFPTDEAHPVVKPMELPNQEICYQDPYCTNDDGTTVKMKQLIQIPLSLLQEMSEVNDLSDFLQYVDNVTLIPSTVKGQDSYIVGVEDTIDARDGFSRDSGTRAVAAKCMPELQAVKLMTSNDPTVLFYPPCTRIERCGGCCTGDLYSCQPVEQETIFVQVIKTQYTGGTRMKYAGKEIIPIEKHTACRCQCRIKASDCTESQEYDSRSCQCKCTNEDDRLKCESMNQTRYWDVSGCVCRCRSDDLCSTGFYYNEDTCQCEQWVARRGDPGIRAVLGEGGRFGGNSLNISDQKAWINRFKEEDDNEDKSSRPVQRFQFPNLKKPTV